MTEDWIKKAFDLAGNEADIAQTINDFLDKYTPEILNQWSMIVGQERTVKFAAKLSEDDDFMECIEILTSCFTVAGYKLALSKTNNKRI